MSRSSLTVVTLLAIGGLLAHGESGRNDPRPIPLPEVSAAVDMPLHRALNERRSIRSYSAATLTVAELGGLLWAAQGITQQHSGFRTAPSAGATFPLEVYAAVGAVDEVPAGLYRYLAADHSLQPLRRDDLRRPLYNAALRQPPVRDAPLVIIITGVNQRTARRYGGRAERYVAMEAGHASQNIYLQATALGLGTVAVGAFDDRSVADLLQLPGGEQPLYLMPVGRPAVTP